MERVKAIFDYVSELEPGERDSALRQVCGEDPELRSKVEKLLEQAQADTQPLPPPPPTPHTTEPVPFIFAAGEVIAGRYRVIRPIAKGGMGEVYEVDDTELGNHVALKTINLKSAARPGALEMFRREISIARQVTHPNVCRIFDIGHHMHEQHGEIIFLTMEMLEGDTLAARIRKSGVFTKEDALPVLEQMAHALAAAHNLGIVHRDFKSSNVILAETASGSARMVKVTDFGLARSVDGLDTTVHNDVWGTPDYMAPEQFHGQFSAASDIYAFGVVVYEMCSGKLPHRSSTGSNKPDGKPSATFSSIPAEWRPIVKKCMAYEPADRYGTIAEVWDALRGKEAAIPSPERRFLGLRVPAAIAVLVLLAVSVLAPVAWVYREKIHRLWDPLPSQKHIAVLPFESVRNNPDDVAFAEGMGQTLTSKLSQLERYQNAFWIVPYSDAKKAHSIDEAYRKLNTNLVITGSVQRGGDEVVMTANLVDAKSHRQLASHVVRASVGNLDLLQNRVWESVADMVDLQVDPQVKRKLASGGTTQPGAYEFYEQAVGYLGRYELSNVEHAIDTFQKAISLDRNYALAYAGLGDAYQAKYVLTKDPHWLQLADDNAQRALALDPHSAWVHITLGAVYRQRGEYEKALAEYRTALDAEPGAVKASKEIGDTYEAMGKTAEAEEQYKSIIERRPGDWNTYNALGWLYDRHGHYDQAAQMFQTMVDLQPDNPLGYQNLGGVLMQMDKYDEAISVLQKGLQCKETPTLVSNLGAAYMLTGKYSEAVPVMERAVQLSPHNDQLWRNLGDSYRQVPALADKANGAYHKALEAAEAQFATNPHDAEVLSLIALYQSHLGERSQAADSISRAVAMSPNNIEIRFTSALVYEIIGHRDQAIAALDKASQGGYSLAVIEREPELQSLRKDSRYKQWLKQKQSS